MSSYDVARCNCLALHHGTKSSRYAITTATAPADDTYAATAGTAGNATISHTQVLPSTISPQQTIPKYPTITSETPLDTPPPKRPLSNHSTQSSLKPPKHPPNTSLTPPKHAA